MALALPRTTSAAASRTSTGYKASCAEGFTYYQWDRKSDRVGGWQDESVTCRTDWAGSAALPDGSCCVADGQTVPAGAALPSDGEDDEDDEDLGVGAAAGLLPGAHALAITVALAYAAAAQ